VKSLIYKCCGLAKSNEEMGQNQCEYISNDN